MHDLIKGLRHTLSASLRGLGKWLRTLYRSIKWRFILRRLGKQAEKEKLEVLLEAAIRDGTHSAVISLLALGARTDRWLPSRQYPVDLAASEGHLSIVRALCEHLWKKLSDCLKVALQ